MECELCDAYQNDGYRIVMSNQHAFAMVIREPILPYHSMVMPIRHVTELSQLTKEESYALHELIDALRLRMDGRIENCSSITLLNGSGHRTERHIHYQVIPVTDGGRTIVSRFYGIPEGQRPEISELEKMAIFLR